MAKLTKETFIESLNSELFRRLDARVTGYEDVVLIDDGGAAHSETAD